MPWERLLFSFWACSQHIFYFHRIITGWWFDDHFCRCYSSIKIFMYYHFDHNMRYSIHSLNSFSFYRFYLNPKTLISFLSAWISFYKHCISLASGLFKNRFLFFPIFPLSTMHYIFMFICWQWQKQTKFAFNKTNFQKKVFLALFQYLF